MTDARIARCKAARLRRRSSTGDDPARLVALHPCLMATAERPLDAHSVRPPLPDHPLTSRSSPVLPAQSTIPTITPAAQSP
jgi:hypothetical protein